MNPGEIHMAEASSDRSSSTAQAAGLATTPSDTPSTAMDGQHQEMPSAVQNNPVCNRSNNICMTAQFFTFCMTLHSIELNTGSSRPALPSQSYSNQASSSQSNHKLNTNHQPSQLAEQPPNSASFSSHFPATTISSQDGVLSSQPRQAPQTDRDTIMGGAPEIPREHPPAIASDGLLYEQVPSGAAGARARMYLNEKIVPFLLEAMKPLARNE